MTVEERGIIALAVLTALGIALVVMGLVRILLLVWDVLRKNVERDITLGAMLSSACVTLFGGFLLWLVHSLTTWLLLLTEG